MIEVEMAEKNDQLATQMSTDPEFVRETQEELKRVASSVLDCMENIEEKKDSEEEEFDDSLELMFEQVEKTAVLQNSLLKSKIETWKIEKMRRITGAEGKVLQQLLESLKVNPFSLYVL